MQPEPFGARQQEIFAPTLRSPIAAAGKQPVDYRQVNGPFDVKFEAPAFEQDAQRLGNAALLP
jgi:hypothetical protein